MGLVFIAVGFAAGVFLSWRQPSSAARGLLVVNGAIGVMFWMINLSGGVVPPNSLLMQVGCFLLGFALGNVARYAESETKSGRVIDSPASTETPEDRPQTQPILPLQAIVVVPTYWLACLAWLWLFSKFTG